METEEFLVITKDVSVVRNDDIIDFMEVFYNVSRGRVVLLRRRLMEFVGPQVMCQCCLRLFLR